MKKHFCLFCSFFALLMSTLSANVHQDECQQNNEKYDFTIVFVHIGHKIPEYLDWALRQARLFNDCKIVLIANEKPLNQSKNFLAAHNIIGVPCESLKKTSHHISFTSKSKLDKNFRDGFWYYASERFFYLDDLMQQHQMSNVIHLESDVMLYTSVLEIAPVLLKNYSGLGVTFDTDNRCIPGFVFIKNSKIISQLTGLMKDLKNTDDMYALGKFREKKGNELVNTLPIIHDEYIQCNSIASIRPENYSNLVGKFDSLFDAAYLGQYLGGEDPRNGPGGPGFVNPHCVINSSFLTYSWEPDKENRLVPYATYNGKKLRINNLHIHSKELWNFYSIK